MPQFAPRVLNGTRTAEGGLQFTDVPGACGDELTRVEIAEDRSDEITAMSKEIIADLRDVQALEGMPEALLALLAGAARVVDIPEKSVVFRQGDPAKCIYLLLSGQVSLEICAPGSGCRRILTVSAGELLGWSPALGQQAMTATARALTNVRAIELDASQLLAECERNPQFGYEFMKRAALALAKRLSATRLQLMNLYGLEMASAVDERRAASVAESMRP